jgi:hypothetical protein
LINPTISAGVEPAYISVAGAAAFFGMSSWWIRNEVRCGRLQAVKIGARTLLVFASVKARAAELNQPATFGASRQARGITR